MEFKPNTLYHVYNRGNNKQKIFFNYGNYLFFIRKIDKHLLPHCDLLAYCLMPNHFHFLIEPKENAKGKEVNKAFQIILSSYSQAINKQENRTGSLFQQHTKSKLLEISDSLYAEVCFHYIHQNPLRAGLVKEIERWEFSSAKEYALMSNQKLCSHEKAQLLLNIPADGKEFLKLSEQVLSEKMIEKIF
jgi:putative transposase